MWNKIDLTWSKNCVLADMTVRVAGIDNNPPAIVALTGLKFQIKYTDYTLQLLLCQKKIIKHFRNNQKQDLKKL